MHFHQRKALIAADVGSAESQPIRLSHSQCHQIQIHEKEENARATEIVAETAITTHTHKRALRGECALEDV